MVACIVGGFCGPSILFSLGTRRRRDNWRVVDLFVVVVVVVCVVKNKLDFCICDDAVVGGGCVVGNDLVQMQILNLG